MLPENDLFLCSSFVVHYIVEKENPAGGKVVYQTTLQRYKQIGLVSYYFKSWYSKGKVNLFTRSTHDFSS